MRHILLSFLLLAFSHTAALAMQCMPSPLEENAQKAQLIFLGVVTSREPVTGERGRCWEKSEEKPNCGPKIATFKVKKLWKGKPAETYDIYSEDACYCLGSYFNQGEEYIVFANPAKEGPPKAEWVAASGCQGTTGLYDHKKDLPQKLDDLFKK